MACFSHINQSGPQGMYEGRFGSYEVSVRDDPISMKTEVMMRYQGVCAGMMFDERDLQKMHMHHGRGESIREIAFGEVARLLDRKLENDRHNSMVNIAKAPDPAEAMYAPNRIASTIRQMQYEVEQRQLRAEMEHNALIALNATQPPKININIDTTHKPKKKKDDWMKNLTLREQLQLETDEWLKEVKVA